jgi:hypothetical protein
MASEIQAVWSNSHSHGQQMKFTLLIDVEWTLQWLRSLKTVSRRLGGRSAEELSGSRYAKGASKQDVSVGQDDLWGRSSQMCTLTRTVEKTKPPRGVYSLDGFATLVTGQIPATSW